MIVDSYGRSINYLRLAVVDRCNLRCSYCMPKEGLNWLSRKELMTNEEMLKICSLLVKMGIEKIRITGGEPFVKKDLLPLLTDLSKLDGLHQLSLTTNGVLTAPFVPELKKIGINHINLSLDSLDKDRFIQITHRDDLSKVIESLEAFLKHGFEVKINAVVMEGVNIEDLIPLVNLTKHLPISVRFIEQMPFNGSGTQSLLNWDALRIWTHIKDNFPRLTQMPGEPHSTATQYHIPGHKGNIGIIAAYSRSFCGSCNRIRITPTGILRTCLYDQGNFNIKNALREGIMEETLKDMITQAVFKKAVDGWEAEKKRKGQKSVHESMATIGG
ncbi:MAG TPA: GTP 3',8-cyclase MoaA [Arachidicoccus sp.]|nr:GTP 3',8-cyclase MoaA [Arachidicoccus sp.]